MTTRKVQAERIGPRPELTRGERVNVDAIGEGLTVAGVKPGEGSWWVEVAFPNGDTWVVPASRVWKP